MSKNKKATNPEDVIDQNANDLENDNALTGDADEVSGPNIVYVFANLPNAQSFKLGSGDTVTIQGMSVSNLKKPGGGFFTGGKYGVTPVDRNAWAEVVKVYGKMKMFQNKLVFAADTIEEGKARARELGGLRHGYEPVDPNSDRVKSTPKDEKD